jgi:hypothetical protein
MRSCQWYDGIQQRHCSSIWNVSPLHLARILWTRSWALTSHTLYERNGGGHLGRRSRSLWSNEDNSGVLDWSPRQTDMLTSLRTLRLLEKHGISYSFFLSVFWLALSWHKKLIILSDEINQSIIAFGAPHRIKDVHYLFCSSSHCTLIYKI